MSRSYVSVPIDRRRCARMRMRQPRLGRSLPTNSQHSTASERRRPAYGPLSSKRPHAWWTRIPCHRPGRPAPVARDASGGCVRQDGCICAVRPATVATARSNLLRRLQAVVRTTDCLISCRPESSSVSRSPRARVSTATVATHCCRRRPLCCRPAGAPAGRCSALRFTTPPAARTDARRRPGLPWPHGGTKSALPAVVLQAFLAFLLPDTSKVLKDAAFFFPACSVNLKDVFTRFQRGTRSTAFLWYCRRRAHILVTICDKWVWKTASKTER
jgi:hypothetical protein